MIALGSSVGASSAGAVEATAVARAGASGSCKGPLSADVVATGSASSRSASVVAGVAGVSPGGSTAGVSSAGRALSGAAGVVGGGDPRPLVVKFRGVGRRGAIDKGSNLQARREVGESMAR